MKMYLYDEHNIFTDIKVNDLCHLGFKFLYLSHDYITQLIDLSLESGLYLSPITLTWLSTILARLDNGYYTRHYVL